MSPGGPSQGPGDEEVIVTGQLVEKGSEDPLSFATAALYREKDSTMVGNAVTEFDGGFQIQAEPGNYYAVFQYVGYEKKVIPDLRIKAGRDTFRLGEVAMLTNAVSLREVEVRAEKSQMEFQLDRRVFNVGKDLTNIGNSAADILDRVPSVTVDAEGNVSLRGSQSVRILVNGNPSGLLSAGETEALLRMQGDIIESIEVITNPSARYEAEGEAGIINIILKKNQEKGVNGSFGLTAGYPQNFGASYNLNYRQQDFNFFSNFGIDYRKFPGGGSSTQEFFNNGDRTEFYTSETDQIRGGLGGYIQFGTDWNIDKYNMITGSLLYRRGRDDNDATVTYRDFDENDELINTTVRDINEIEDENNFEGSLLYRRTFDQEDREWTVTAKYILDEETEIADYVETDDLEPNALIQNSRNEEDESNFLFQTDYIHPIGEKTRLEGGLRAALRTVNNNFFVEELLDNGEVVTLPDFDDQLKYQENIYAAYFIGAHELGPISLQGGLRVELSDITASLVRSGESNDQNYLSLFPSASMAYKFSEKDQIQASYSRRLSRPYFRRLLPFSNFNNPRNNSIGNPNLRPEFTHSFELGYLHYFTNGSLLANVYYRNTSGVIERIVLPSDDATTILFPVNLATRNSYGLEINLGYDLAPWWNINANTNFFRSLVDGTYEGRDYSADAYAWNARVNTKIDIGEKFVIQASFDYDAPRNTTQGRSLSSYTFDLAASLEIFKGKGTLTLSGRDLFNTRIRRSIVDTPEYKSESSFQWRRSQQITMQFNYRLNQDRKRNAQRGSGGDRF